MATLNGDQILTNVFDEDDNTLQVEVRQVHFGGTPQAYGVDATGRSRAEQCRMDGICRGGFDADTRSA